MSYHKVIYEKLFPYAPYLNERIGIEILVETGQSPYDALQNAKDIVDQFYKLNAPQQPIPETHSIVADNQIVPIVQVEEPVVQVNSASGLRTFPSGLPPAKSPYLKNSGLLMP